MAVRPNYFYVNRALLDSEMWLGDSFSRGQAWVDLIGRAKWQGGWVRIRGVRIDLARGQLAASIVYLADRWKWSQGKVRRFLDELETDGRIEQQKTNVTTVVTIINYDAYQKTEGQTEYQTESKQRANSIANGEQTEGQTEYQTETYKKEQEFKKEQEPPPPTPSKTLGGGGGFLKAGKPEASAPEPAKPPPKASASVGWREVEGLLARAGVADAAGAIRQAKSRELTAPEVAAIVAYWRENPGLWGAPALHWRVRSGVSGQPPGEGWPPPDRSEQRSQRKASQRSEQSRQARATKLIRDGRSRGLSDAEIQKLLDQEGLTWP